METIKKKIHFKLNLFEIVLISSVIILNIIDCHVKSNINYLGILTSIIGVVSVVLAAKGHLLNFGFGTIKFMLYSYICYQSKFYGEVMLNLGFYFPMQIAGFYFWKKHVTSKTENIIKTHGLTNLQRIVILTSVILLTALYAYFLEYIGGKSPVLDSATTVVAIVTMILAILRYKEQWYLWILVNIATVVLWITSLESPTEYSFIMIGMRSLYFINSVYGAYNWNRLDKE